MQIYNIKHWPLKQYWLGTTPVGSVVCGRLIKKFLIMFATNSILRFTACNNKQRALPCAILHTKSCKYEIAHNYVLFIFMIYMSYLPDIHMFYLWYTQVDRYIKKKKLPANYLQWHNNDHVLQRRTHTSHFVSTYN